MGRGDEKLGSSLRNSGNSNRGNNNNKKKGQQQKGKGNNNQKNNKGRESLKGKDRGKQSNQKDNNYKGGKNAKIHGEKGNFTILLTGFSKSSEPDIGHLMEALSKQANGGKPLTLNNSDYQPKERKLCITVEHHGEALSLVKAGSFKYFGDQLRLRSIPTRAVGARKDLFPVFRDALPPRFDSHSRLLNLRQLHNHLQDRSVRLGGPGVLAALLLVACELFPSLKSLDLTDNGIASLSGFKDISLPDLCNVCLEDNRIGAFAELDHLKAFRVQNVILLGNPVHARDSMEYKSEVLRRFPALRWLDRQQVAPSISLPVELPPPSAFPPLKGSFCGVTGGQKQIGHFIKVYHDKFDNNRNDLFKVYTERSYFSYSCVASGGSGGGQQQGGGDEGKKGRGDQLRQYASHNGNLLEVTKYDQRKKAIAKGRLDILHLIKSLPETKHDIASITIDCYPIPNISPNLMLISISGKFWEVHAKVNRNFTRTLVVSASSTPIILNDELNVRIFKEAKPIKVLSAADHKKGASLMDSEFTSGIDSTSLFDSEGPSSSSSSNSADFLNLPPKKIEMLNKYRTITSSDLQSAYDVLSRNNWNYDRALGSDFRTDLLYD